MSPKDLPVPEIELAEQRPGGAVVIAGGRQSGGSGSSFSRNSRIRTRSFWRAL